MNAILRGHPLRDVLPAAAAIEAAPAFAEFHRAQLRAIAAGTGAQMATEAVHAALLAAGVCANPPETLRRLRDQIGTGSPSIMVWQEEAAALLERLPAPPAAPTPAEDTAADVRADALAIYRDASAHAEDLAGHDERVRAAFNRLAIRALTLAAKLPSAPTPGLTARAAALFGKG